MHSVPLGIDDYQACLGLPAPFVCHRWQNNGLLSHDSGVEVHYARLVIAYQQVLHAALMITSLYGAFLPPCLPLLAEE